MKKILVLLVISVFGWIGISNATPVTLTDVTLFNAGGTDAPGDYVDHGWGDVNRLDGITDYVAWQHQFTFDPPANYLISANLTLWFTDVGERGDGGFLGWKNEYAFGYAESGDWGFGEIDTGSYSYDIGIGELYDGIFEVKVASIYGNFNLDKSELSIDYAPVPEPGTALLLGTGLAGLAMYRRKRK